MSEASDTQDETPLDRAIDTLVEYEDQIVENRDLIRVGLEEQIKPSEPRIRSGDVVNGIAMALSSSLDEDDATQVSSALLNCLTNATTDFIAQIKEREPRDELLTFMAEVSMKYQMPASALLSAEVEGPNYWTRVDTDLTIRSPQAQPSLTHHVILNQGRTVDIDTNLDSNLRLARYLLSQHIEALDLLGDDISSRVDQNIIADIADTVSEIQERDEEFSTEADQPTDTEQ